jgi:hypothetical protein
MRKTLSYSKEGSEKNILIFLDRTENKVVLIRSMLMLRIFSSIISKRSIPINEAVIFADFLKEFK